MHMFAAASPLVIRAVDGRHIVHHLCIQLPGFTNGLPPEESGPNCQMLGSQRWRCQSHSKAVRHAWDLAPATRLQALCLPTVVQQSEWHPQLQLEKGEDVRPPDQPTMAGTGC